MIAESEQRKDDMASVRASLNAELDKVKEAVRQQVKCCPPGVSIPYHSY